MEAKIGDPLPWEKGATATLDSKVPPPDGPDAMPWEKTTRLDGKGVLSGLTFPEDEVSARVRKNMHEAAERDAERKEQTRQQIAAIWEPSLKNELALERVPNPQVGKDWGMFSNYCAQLGLPMLPATPESIVGFLGEAKAADVSRLYRSIRAIHDAYYDHPCAHPLVLASLRQARASKSSTTKPPQANGKGVH